MNDKCSHCGNTETVIAIQQGYAEVTPIGKVFTRKAQSLYHVICLNCGTVIRSFVEDPQKLVIKEKKRGGTHHEKNER